jgi:ABC-2 type transport system ATP-binding protein
LEWRVTPSIEACHLVKRFGPVLAVDDVSFEVAPGRMTGFLGPNGAGKTTTLRMLLGLVTPTSGMARIDGRPYQELACPPRQVGVALESAGAHPGRTARGHLRLQTLAPCLRYSVQGRPAVCVSDRGGGHGIGIRRIRW